MKYVEEEETTQIVEEEEYGCPYCWNKKKKQERELYFFDTSNNLRLCHYCPNCGRKYSEERL